MWRCKLAWIVETFGTVVDDEIAALPKDMQAAFLRLSERIEAVGPLALREPHVKHLHHKLWEMRFGGRDGIGRAIYFVAIGRRVIVVHAFVKKQQKTPAAALRLAEQRMKEFSR